MKHTLLAGLAALLLALPTALHAAEITAVQPIDRETLDKWSAPYRGWHYQPDHVISADPKIPGHEDFKNTDVPCVYQMPGQPDKWYMSFIAFNGKGYNSFVAESPDLVRWTNPKLAMGFGKEGEFDFGGCVMGAYLYESYDIKAPRLLKKRDGKYWTLYGCYAKQGGFECDPGYEGVAVSEDGMTWKRAKEKYILSTAHPEPLYKAGGNPSGLDSTYAHKISLVYNPKNETFYLYYCACGNKGRGIGLITSKPLPNNGKTDN